MGGYSSFPWDDDTLMKWFQAGQIRDIQSVPERIIEEYLLLLS